MNSPKKLLVVSPIPFLPLTQGNRTRLRSLMEIFENRGWQISFLYLRTENDADERMMRAHLEGRFAALAFDSGRFDPLRLERPGRFDTLLRRLLFWACHGRRTGPQSRAQRRGGRWARTALRPLLFLLFGDAFFSHAIDELYPESLDTLLADLSRSTAFDAVLVEYVYLSRAFLSFDEPVLKILDTHDVFSYRHRLFARRGMYPRGFSTLPAEEKKGLDRADVILAIQKTEAQTFKKLTTKPVITLGLSINDPPPDRSTSGDPAPLLLFVGSSNRCNIDGVNNFIRKVLAPLQRTVPGLRLLLVGSICNVIADAEGVEKAGCISDLNVFYGQALAVVNPVRFGTGLKIKTIEALSYQQALVTSAHGASGIEEWAGRAFLMASNWKQFRRLLEEVCADPALRTRLKLGAQQFTNANRAAVEDAAQALFSYERSRHGKMPCC